VFSFAPSREFSLCGPCLGRRFGGFSASGAVWSFSGFSRGSDGC